MKSLSSGSFFVDERGTEMLRISNKFMHAARLFAYAVTACMILSGSVTQASELKLSTEVSQEAKRTKKKKKTYKKSRKKKKTSKKKVKAKKKVRKAKIKKSRRSKKKASAKVIRTPSLLPGEIAINQKKYLQNYDRAKSTFLYQELMNYRDDIDVSQLGYTIDMSRAQESLDECSLRRTYNLMLLEHPDLIHVSREFGVSVNPDTGLITHVKPVYSIPQEKYAEAMRQTYAASDRIANTARKKKGIRDRIKYVDRAIRSKVTYKITDTGVGAYGALVKGKAFCMGYARAFSLCMSRLNLPCAYELTEEHVWNRVKVDGHWYVVDVTYNDDDVQLINLLSENHEEPIVIG
jgi:transglutaminase/protease-like cytokinesis protein 3